jgi:hypothetical protein
MFLSQNKRKIGANAKCRILACKFVAELLIPVSIIFMCVLFCVCVRVGWCILHTYTHEHTHKHTYTVLGKVIHVRAMKGQAPRGAE